MNNLHKNQISLLNILEQNIDHPLTIREIQTELSFSSPSVVAHHIQQLEKKGYLKRNPGNSRDYQVFQNPESTIIHLNLYGNAQCGPNGSILDGNPKDRIPIASRLLKFPVQDGFIVEARGDSMEPQINQGDLVITQTKKTANNGDIIVCVYDEKVLIKKFFKKDGYITLLSSNSEKYEPINVAENVYFKIEGIVRNILQYK